MVSEANTNSETHKSSETHDGESYGQRIANAYAPPLPLRQGLSMTLYTALVTCQRWQRTLTLCEPQYQPFQFTGADQVPLFGQIAIPPQARGTIVATYGITGDLTNQGYLRALGAKAYHQGYAVVLFDWRAHGKSALLSPTLTSDGLFEGKDFVHIAAQAIAQGCPSPIWFSGYSLGGQLALWGLKAAEDAALIKALELQPDDIAGGFVVCPNLDAWRSLNYLVEQPIGHLLEQRIASGLKTLADELDAVHPGAFDRAAIDRADSILAFDRELVIGRLGFDSVESYYYASSPFRFLEQLQRQCLIFYAADDPLFDPSIVPDLQATAVTNPNLTLCLTPMGGHVGYLSSRTCQRQRGDRDPWWVWNRSLEWIKKHPAFRTSLNS